jgi:hypothetical protein
MFIISLFLISGCSNNDTETTSEVNPEVTINTETEDTSNVVEQTTDIPEEIIDTPKPTADHSVDWIEFVNEDKNFSLVYPSNWVIVDTESYGIVLSPTNDTQTTFIVDTYTKKYRLYSDEDFLDDMISSLINSREDATFSEAVTILINDYSFTTMDYYSTNDTGDNYLYRVFFTANKLGYEMYYVAAQYGLYQATMEEIALSFKFIQ